MTLCVNVFGLYLMLKDNEFTCTLLVEIELYIIIKHCYIINVFHMLVLVFSGNVLFEVDYFAQVN